MLAPAYSTLSLSLLVHFAQATLFGAIIALALLALPVADARLRYWLGWFGLAKFVLPLGLLGLSVPALAPAWFSGHWLPSLLGPAAPSPTTGAPAVLSWPVFFGIVWASGIIALAVWHAVQTWLCARQLRANRTPFSPQEAVHLAELARRMGLNPARIQGWTTAADIAPGMFGIFRSGIHVPRELLRLLTRDETEAVLLHELVHVARRDNLWRLAQTVIVCLCWFHPLVWWLHRRLIQESEQACDEAVVRLTRNHETYVQGLLKAARFALGLSAPGFPGMARHGLKTRLAALLNPTLKKDHPMLRLVLFLCVLTGFVATSDATGLSESPATETYPIDKLEIKPTPISLPPPKYPFALYKNGTEGEVIVGFVVDRGGQIKNAVVIRSTHPEFEAPALEAVNQWKFKPGMKDGQLVNTSARQAIFFRLKK